MQTGYWEGQHFARTPNAFYLEGFREQLPELEEYVRLAPIFSSVMEYNDTNYKLSQGYECDSNFFSVFDAELLIGNHETVFDIPGSMIVSESFAKRVFGTEDPIGQVLTCPSGQHTPNPQHYTINGVMKDFPVNSHFHPDFIATPVNKASLNGWAWCYLLLTEGADPSKITDAYIRHRAKEQNISIDDVKSQAYLQKLTDIHLHSHKLREIEANGNISNIYVLAIAAIVLLLISISNYANLNLGMAGFSTKYLFVNKLMGASSKKIFAFFFTEGVLILITSCVLAFLVSIPINVIVTHQFNTQLLSGNGTIIILIYLIYSVISILIGMLPVIKPALRFLKKGLGEDVKHRKGGVSKILIISQYAFSIALIVAVILISKQNSYALEKGMGSKNDNIVCFDLVHADVQKQFKIFKSELLKHSSIIRVSAMIEPPGGQANDLFAFKLEDYISTHKDPNKDRIGILPCDYSFASIFNLQFLCGDNFSERYTDNEGSGEYIINRSAMHRFNYTDPNEIIGKSFYFDINFPGIKIPRGKIIGVVEDFHLSSIKSEIEPLVLFKRDKLWLHNFVIQHKVGMKEEALADMKKVWEQLFPEYPFQHEEVGAMYQKVYKSELLQAKLLSIFTVLALFICSMGLLGLALIITQQRTKEIGIRKVNGSTTFQILLMLNKDFIKWVAIAFVVSCPIAYYSMSKWLENFAYKTGLSWWIFILAGLLVCGIALLTVSWQSLKAAKRNPIESLRYE